MAAIPPWTLVGARRWTITSRTLVFSASSASRTALPVAMTLSNMVVVLGSLILLESTAVKQTLGLA